MILVKVLCNYELLSCLEKSEEGEVFSRPKTAIPQVGKRAKLSDL